MEVAYEKEGPGHHCESGHGGSAVISQLSAGFGGGPSSSFEIGGISAGLVSVEMRQ